MLKPETAEEKKAWMARQRRLSELIATWEPLSDEEAMPEIEDYPPEPVDF